MNALRISLVTVSALALLAGCTMHHGKSSTAHVKTMAACCKGGGDAGCAKTGGDSKCSSGKASGACSHGSGEKTSCPHAAACKGESGKGSAGCCQKK